MRWYRFGTDFFACDCEKLKMYWMYIEFFGKKPAEKDVPKMCRRINQRFLYLYSPIQRVQQLGDVLLGQAVHGGRGHQCPAILVGQQVHAAEVGHYI